MFDALSFLQGVPLFDGIEPRVLQSIASRSDVVPLQPGLVLAEAGGPAESLWLIHSGLISLCIPLNPGELLPVQILGPMGAYGYGALLDGARFLFAARGLTTGAVLRVPRESLARELSEDPRAAAVIYKSLVGDLLYRLDSTLGLVTDVTRSVRQETECPFGLPSTLTTFILPGKDVVIGACPLVGTCPVGLERGCPIAHIRTGAAPRLWPPPSG